MEPGLEPSSHDWTVSKPTARLGAVSVLVGERLADDMGPLLYQPVRLKSSNGVEMVLTVTGIYQIGQGGFDRRTAYFSLNTARTLFALPQGVTRIGIMLVDLYAADAVATLISAVTGLIVRLVGAGMGYLALLPFPGPSHFQSGTQPVAITEGSYRLAILLTFIGATLALISPARSAAWVDPVEAIGQ
ncbi:MAG: hypothetical protein ACOH2H_17310 [Cypionkella sp.]